MRDHFPELAESESKFVAQTIKQLVNSVISKCRDLISSPMTIFDILPNQKRGQGVEQAYLCISRLIKALGKSVLSKAF